MGVGREGYTSAHPRAELMVNIAFASSLDYCKQSNPNLTLANAKLAGGFFLGNVV